MKIKKGAMVTFHCEVKNEQGEVVDSTFDGQPLTYVHGEGDIIEGLEEFLDGEEPGFEAKVSIPAEKAYGVSVDDLKVYAGPENFDDNVAIEIGSIVETEDPDGELIQFRIIEIEDDKVFLDGNHPLADQTLEYRVEVLEVK